ncbi:MAG: hypothetical protein WC236_05935 [Gallionellaceae bacterium]|jgi:hypothetical protein
MSRNHSIGKLENQDEQQGQQPAEQRRNPDMPATATPASIRPAQYASMHNRLR